MKLLDSNMFIIVAGSWSKMVFIPFQVVGYKGPAVAVVSCVTVDPPYRPHPHNLVGKEGCKKGVCTMRINQDSMQVVFSNLGIQCIKKRDVEDALKLREEIRVDPFQSESCEWQMNAWDVKEYLKTTSC